MSENKRYSFKYYNDVYMIRIIDNYKEEPNGWGVCNVKETVQRLNELNEEKEILEVQLKSATNEIEKLMSEINTLTDTCHDCCKEIREENKELKNKLAKVEEILNNRLSDDFLPVHSDGITELFVEEKVGYWRALKQLKKKLIKENIIKEDMND